MAKNLPFQLARVAFPAAKGSQVIPQVATERALPIFRPTPAFQPKNQPIIPTAVQLLLDEPPMNQIPLSIQRLLSLTNTIPEMSSIPTITEPTTQPESLEMTSGKIRKYRPEEVTGLYKNVRQQRKTVRYSVAKKRQTLFKPPSFQQFQNLE
eukprot:TRINITY_DN2110_c0_g1::TRINITY_DN2110_c0_g1_i1::g.12786::m.12786 TRINITY_DN2110_c0_g1::TRINITY_DN2110_c0_g1_i1::g.12786  ORF type:complete len:152 (+),score=6.03 TRINITY_DN2110_c0_g1_i1:35-490(+)